MIEEKHIIKLNEIWNNLLDFYYHNTNKQEWLKFISNLKRIERIKNEIVGCKAAFAMIELNDERGYEHLKLFGIDSTDTTKIRSAILVKETNLEFAENKLTTDQKKDKKKDFKEVFDLYKNLASAEFQTKRNIDINTVCLAEWVAIIVDLAERNRAANAEIKKSMNKVKRIKR